MTRTELEPALGKKLSDTFNFTRRERLSAVINPADGKVETITISSFDQMPDKAILEEALHEFTNQGGAVDPAVIHHRASQRNKRPLI